MIFYVAPQTTTYCHTMLRPRTSQMLYLSTFYYRNVMVCVSQSQPPANSHHSPWRHARGCPVLTGPEHLALFPIESHSFLSYLSLSISSYPCLVLSCHSFPLSTLYLSSPYHTLLYPYTSGPSRSPSLVLLSISSLYTLCIPRFEYHLWYSLLWSDPVHVLSLTCSQLTHLWPFSSSTTSMSLSTSSRLQQCLTHVTDTRRCPMPHLNPIEVIHTWAATPLLFPIGRIPFFSKLLGLPSCALAFLCSGVHSHWTLSLL